MNTGTHYTPETQHATMLSQMFHTRIPSMYSGCLFPRLHTKLHLFRSLYGVQDSRMGNQYGGLKPDGTRLTQLPRRGRRARR